MPPNPSDSLSSVDKLHTIYERLFTEHYSALLTTATARLNDVDEAENVVAEVFTAAWRRKTDAAVLTAPWLYRTLHNHIGNEYRRRKRAARREHHLAETLRPADLHADHFGEHKEFHRTIAQLTPRERELIWMAYWEDRSSTEIAQLLGCSQGTARVRLLRAKQKLKARLEASIHNDDPALR